MLKNLYTYFFIDDLIEQSGASGCIGRMPFKRQLTGDFAGLTLIVYILLVFNPVVPIISDKVAHTFWEEYHMVTVHHVYGNGHVNAELDKATKQAQKDKTSKTNTDDYLHIVTTISYNFSTIANVNESYAPYRVNLPANYSNINYPPPKIA